MGVEEIYFPLTLTLSPIGGEGIKREVLDLTIKGQAKLKTPSPPSGGRATVSAVKG